MALLQVTLFGHYQTGLVKDNIGGLGASKALGSVRQVTCSDQGPAYCKLPEMETAMDD